MSMCLVHWFDDQEKDEAPIAERKSRRKWSLIEDLVLITSWLNTSKDHVVSNGQKSRTFWQRITDYFATSQKLKGTAKRRKCKEQQREESVCVPAGIEENQSQSKIRSPGVKAANTKFQAKPSSASGDNLKELQLIWDIKEKDLAAREKLINKEEKRREYWSD
ncbi:unnamed protein product [Arabidopsis thaliana]|uniref:(thale cress) hypothetical protein n=1 Tax=Arabidopsis thaliana TaxID=3702 RepID=A0A7G2EVH7_ARATH|nr:unnamed protein product [Arabidopsis thaliana]